MKNYGNKTFKKCIFIMKYEACPRYQHSAVSWCIPGSLYANIFNVSLWNRMTDNSYSFVLWCTFECNKLLQNKCRARLDSKHWLLICVWHLRVEVDECKLVGEESLRNSSPKNEHLLKMSSPSGHPDVDEFDSYKHTVSSCIYTKLTKPKPSKVCHYTVHNSIIIEKSIFGSK